MEEDLRCIPYIDGVVHEAHPYTPQDYDEEMWCAGWENLHGNNDAVEIRQGGQYRVAMWVDYSGVRTLHKMGIPESLEDARKWIEEFKEDAPGMKVFIIRETTEVRSVVVE